MIKRFLYIFLFLFLFIHSKTQQSYIDSLQHELKIAQNDTAKITVLIAISQYYGETKPDSSVYFAQQRLTIARKLDLPLDEVDALIYMGYGLVNLGNYPLALQYLVEALKIAEDPGSEKNIRQLSANETPVKARLTALASVHLQLGNVYRATGNIERQLYHFKQCEKITTEIKDMSLLSFAHIQLGLTYISEGKLDSALYFELRALEHRADDYTKFYRGKILNSIGLIYYKKSNYKLSRQYLTDAIRESQGQNMLQPLGDAYVNVANLLGKTGDNDSSLWYAKKGLEIFQTTGSLYGLKDAYTALSEAYKISNNIDSAFLYQGLAMVAKDSLNNTEKVKQFQNIGFNEQIRQRELEQEKIQIQNKIRTYVLLAGIAVFILITFLLFRNNRHRKKANIILGKQKAELQATLLDLKNTQSQLIQSEKMASLGELTAGIAHEIQNPLNFVNNFSDVNAELIEELNTERLKPNPERNEQLENEILNDIKENEQKINHHGKRADAIVKNMLQHSRASSGKKEPTGINALAEEYLRLSYHGLRAKDKSFNASMKTDFDESIGKINIVPQDIGRVILNLINNAFYAVDEKKKQIGDSYEPTVSVNTKKINGKIEISVKDNGSGIPKKVLDKIFQPFFTTKPTGQGTGLGLSLSYDIVKAHGGEVKVETNEGEGSEFIIQLPGN